MISIGLPLCSEWSVSLKVILELVPVQPIERVLQYHTRKQIDFASTDIYLEQARMSAVLNGDDICGTEQAFLQPSSPQLLLKCKRISTSLRSRSDHIFGTPPMWWREDKAIYVTILTKVAEVRMAGRSWTP